MAGQKGRDVLIKISDGGVPENFITLAGIRSSEIDLNAGSVDGTAMDSVDGWRELVPGAGVKSARVRGRGVFKDAASDARMRTIFFAGEISRWQLVIPGLGSLTGPLQISEMRWAGTHDGEATFSVDLESAGQLTFEPAQ
ncbi:MAG: phage major tail protein, TP901-1 family [Henriciella sp.]|nr:phage major tail protein, TP901-1 family [Henriciella sp.]